MGDLDEVSLAIGRIEASQKSIEKSQEAQWTKLNNIDRTLTKHRITVAGIAGTVSLAISALVAWFKGGVNH